MKKGIIGFVLGALIFGSIGVVSAYTIFANDIGYTPKDTSWEVDNVKDAIDDLYSKANISEKNVEDFYFIVWTVDNGFYFSNYQNYKYFKITEMDSGTSNSLILKKYDWSNGGAETSLQTNTKYEITKNNEQVVIRTNTGYRNIKIEFFKN